jgi:hypothetical protein
MGDSHLCPLTPHISQTNHVRNGPLASFIGMGRSITLQEEGLAVVQRGNIQFNILICVGYVKFVLEKFVDK